MQLINLQLFESLPFLSKPSYAAFRLLENGEQPQLRDEHFTRLHRPKTLGELTYNWDMECGEHALAIREVQLPTWDIYAIIKKDLTIGRHIVLAHEFDTEHMMIVDPTSRALHSIRSGPNCIIHNEEFEATYIHRELKQD